MKIRLVSITGRIADPAYNVAKMKDKVTQAEKEGVDLLVFPSNSILSTSIGYPCQNMTYSVASEAALEDFAEFAASSPVEIVYKGSHLEKWGYDFYFDLGGEFESVSKAMKRERIAEFESESPNAFYIFCKGRGTESVCQGVYSNAKIIAFEGKVLASNKDTDADQLDLEFEETHFYERHPYLRGIYDLDEMFSHILRMQIAGLTGKMEKMGRNKICLGVSGGLDSTISLMVCVEAFKAKGIPLKNLIGVTMPGLGTTRRTYENALALMKETGINALDIDLRPVLLEHLENIKQPEGVFDVTYEQCQSRERTQVLLDLANKENAVMVGTGCMSEFALGWMTYGGDHLSMYAINVGLPKTLVKMYAIWFIERYSRNKKKSALAAIIKDILDGPVSPELLPIDEKGEQHEETESIIGDYEVLDFIIYQIMCQGSSMKDIFADTCKAFHEYSKEKLFGWFKTCVFRFFTRQYKKNCYGDGLQILDYSVSPFTGYRMPSDIEWNIWKDELDEIEKDLSK